MKKQIVFRETKCYWLSIARNSWYNCSSGTRTREIQKTKFWSNIFNWTIFVSRCSHTTNSTKKNISSYVVIWHSFFPLCCFFDMVIICLSNNITPYSFINLAHPRKISLSWKKLASGVRLFIPSSVNDCYWYFNFSI